MVICFSIALLEICWAVSLIFFAFFYSTEFSSLSKPGPYITHNATWQPAVQSALICNTHTNTHTLPCSLCVFLLHNCTCTPQAQTHRHLSSSSSECAALTSLLAWVSGSQSCSHAGWQAAPAGVGAGCSTSAAGLTPLGLCQPAGLVDCGDTVVTLLGLNEPGAVGLD